MKRRRRRIALLCLIVVITLASGLISNLLISSLAKPKPVAISPVHYSVGIATCTFFDPTRSTPNYLNNTSKKGRLLVTEVRYPTLSSVRGMLETPDAPPALRYGPFPMVVFGHGYALTPDSYAKLLDHWVGAGFVVAAPMFPDTSQQAVASIGVANSFLPEADDINQPGDMAFVTREMLKSTGKTSPLCSIARGLIDHTKIALAGQSDGATTAVALAYDPKYQTASVKYRAVIDLSGELLGAGTLTPDALSVKQSSPSLFVSQSATDTCNPPQFSLAIYNGVHTSHKWFLKILSGHHLPPYIGTSVPAFNAVTSTTTLFLQDEFAGIVPGRALLKLGNTHPLVATLSTGQHAPAIAPLTQGPGSCYLTS
ncbi:MAG TPA: hypothetical protein VNE42_12270 [Acidimicrobiales bacterium]|nr:hypothetical protein [Acidimicrobiales bacterium]